MISLKFGGKYDSMLVHKDFKLNGISYNEESLIKKVHVWVKSKDDEEMELGRFLISWLGKNINISLQTSGSTGTPKTILVTKDAMLASAKQTAAVFNLKPNDSALLCLPMRYIAGKMMLVRALVLGLNLSMIPPKSNLKLDKKYVFVALIPIQVIQVFENLKNIKIVLIGGAPIPLNLRKKIAAKFKNCIETYGMTETLTHVALRPVTYPSIPFKTLPDVVISKGKDECLILKVPYLNKSPIITQDIVELHTSNTFSLLGRKDWTINSGGKKIFPEVLEQKFKSSIKYPFFFAGIPDSSLGEKLVLIIMSQPKIDIKFNKIFKSKKIDRNEIPKDIFYVNTFIRTKTGKLDRKATIKKYILSKL